MKYMSESTYKVIGSRVSGNGYSYNCTSRIDAERLCNTLNTYENTINLNKTIDQQFDKITKQIIQIKLSIGILNEDINTLKTVIENVRTD